MVFRKIVLLLMMLAFYCASVFAGNMVEVDRAVLKIPKTANLSTHVDFMKGNRGCALPAAASMAISPFISCASIRADLRCGLWIRP